MIKLSASSIGTYEKCPKKYYYHYIEKPEVAKQDWSHLELGKCAHRALELFHQDLIENVRTPDEYVRIMSTSFKLALKEFDINILRDSLPELKKILQSYLKNLQDEGLTEVVANERNFEYMIGPYQVRGFIDRIDKIGENAYKVVDYKTNKNPKYLNNFQLLLYALALKEMIPNIERIEGEYILLKHECKKLSYIFTEKNYEETKQKVLSVGKSIDLGKEWEKKPSPLCNWCDYQTICQGSWI